MTTPYLSTEDFLLAAKHYEINTLKQLMISCDLVIKVTELIHELQRERGLSNSYLVSHGKRLAELRLEELAASEQAEQRFRSSLSQLNLKDCGIGSTRLFSNIAFVLHLLDELPTTRQNITTQSVSAKENTKQFNRLIAGLLAVVFEAADVSNDPDITKALVALFNFCQGKEYSGQERAWGVIGFTAGGFPTSQRDHIHALQEAQGRCFDIFTEFSYAASITQWQQLEEGKLTAEVNRLRQLIARFRPGDTLPTSLSEVWYEATTARIDQMQIIEQEMAQTLQQLCRDKVQLTEEELDLHRQHLKELVNMEEPPMSPLTSLEESQQTTTPMGITPGFNIKLARSISDVVQHQAAHIQRVSDELLAAKQTLNERKVIEKAKGILMQTRNISEEDAYKQLRQTAMNGNKRIIDIADNIISVASMLESL